jgi:coenzyme Q-binding protein COQ10
MPSADHVETFNCTPPEFFKLIADYEKYPEFLQEVKGCKILKSETGKKLVEYQVSVIKSFKYQLWCREEQDKLVAWEFASGDIFKTSSGHWKLSAVGEKTKAEYHVEATFSMFVPGPIAKTLLSVNLPAMMSAYHKRVKAVYGK